MLTKTIITLDGMQFDHLQNAFKTYLTQAQATLTDIQTQVQAQVDADKAESNVVDIKREA